MFVFVFISINVFVEVDVNFKQEYLDNFMPLIIIFFFSLFYKFLV